MAPAPTQLPAFGITLVKDAPCPSTLPALITDGHSCRINGRGRTVTQCCGADTDPGEATGGSGQAEGRPRRSRRSDERIGAGGRLSTQIQEKRREDWGRQKAVVCTKLFHVLIHRFTASLTINSEQCHPCLTFTTGNTCNDPLCARASLCCDGAGLNLLSQQSVEKEPLPLRPQHRRHWTSGGFTSPEFQQ